MPNINIIIALKVIKSIKFQHLMLNYYKNSILRLCFIIVYACKFKK